MVSIRSVGPRRTSRSVLRGPAAPVTPGRHSEGREGLSIWDPIHLGIDEALGCQSITLAERNLLIGGEPGGGKSGALNLLVGHAAVSTDCRLVLLDGKQVELGLWRRPADIFVGPSISDAIDQLGVVTAEMDHRYDTLLLNEESKILPGVPGAEPILVAVDEVAYYSALGHRGHQGPTGCVHRRPAGSRDPWAGGRHHHRGRNSAAHVRGRFTVAAGPVRVPVGVPLHHPGVLGRHPRQRVRQRSTSTGGSSPSAHRPLRQITPDPSSHAQELVHRSQALDLAARVPQ